MEDLTLSEKIKIELSRRSMSQAVLAKELGVEPMTISRRFSTGEWKSVEVFYMRSKLNFKI